MLSMRKGFYVIKSNGNMVTKGMDDLVLAIRKWMMIIIDQCDQSLNQKRVGYR